MSFNGAYLAVGNLRFSVYPTLSDVYFDTTFEGTTDSSGILVINNIPAGVINYTIKKSGYYDRQGSVSVTEGITTLVSVILNLVLGSLFITSNPPGAQIYVDNIDTGYTTPSTVPNIAQGNHTYKLTLLGYSDKIGDFVATNGTITVVSLITWMPANITATNMVITQSETPCLAGTCTIHADVTWTNGGETDGIFTPNITVDTIPVSPAPYTSRNLAAETTVTLGFDVVEPAGTYSICPSPNQ